MVFAHLRYRVENRLQIDERGEAVGLVLWLMLTLAVASMGSRFTIPQIDGWYAALRKPSWTPPNWLFGPVWLALYLAMAVSAWLVWRERGFSGAPLPLLAFAVQLALNAAWSVLFFGLQNPGAALVDIVLLWLAIVFTAVLFWPINAWAAALMIPYLLWVGFAAALNFQIWRMNR